MIYNTKQDSAFHIERFPASSRDAYMCAVWTVHIHGLWIPAMAQGQSGFTSHWLSFTVTMVTHLVWEFCSTKESFGRRTLRILVILYSHHWFTVPFNGFPLVVFLLRDYCTCALLCWLSASFFSVFSAPQVLLMRKEDPPECYKDLVFIIL